MSSVMETQIRTALRLESGMQHMLHLIDLQAKSYSSVLYSEDEIRLDLIEMLQTAITYGQLKEFHENHLSHGKEQTQKGS